MGNNLGLFHPSVSGAARMYENIDAYVANRMPKVKLGRLINRNRDAKAVRSPSCLG